MTTTLLLGPLDFQTFLRPCLVLLYQFPTMPVKWWGNCDRRLASVSTKNKFRLLKFYRLGYCFVLLIFQEIFIFRWNCSDRAVARSENPGGLVVMGGDNVPTLVEICDGPAMKIKKIRKKHKHTSSSSSPSKNSVLVGTSVSSGSSSGCSLSNVSGSWSNMSSEGAFFFSSSSRAAFSSFCCLK